MLVISTSCSGAPCTVTLPTPFPDVFQDPESRTFLGISSILLGESSSAFSDLHAITTHSALVSDCAQTHLSPSGVSCPPTFSLPWLSRRGSPYLGPAAYRRAPIGVNGSTQTWASSELDACLPEQSSRPSVGRDWPLFPPLSSHRYACCCPEVSPPPWAPSQKGIS